MADIICRQPEELPGNVRFIFQPSEDTLPGGALPMIKEGALQHPSVNAIFTLHLYSNFPEGTVVAKPGNISTSSTSFTLTLRGRGGHVGSPHKAVNPVLMAGMLITTSQGLLPKKLAPGDPLVFEFAAIHGGTVSNIVPDNVVMKGSIRVSSSDQLEEMIDRFEEVTRGIVELSGGDFTLEYQKGYPTIFNDPDLLNVWQGAAAKVVGMDRCAHT